MAKTSFPPQRARQLQRRINRVQVHRAAARRGWFQAKNVHEVIRTAFAEWKNGTLPEVSLLPISSSEESQESRVFGKTDTADISDSTSVTEASENIRMRSVSSVLISQRPSETLLEEQSS